MCGIVGYVGPQNAVPILVDGLSRLEYRGYDSAGLAVVSSGGIATRRVQGKLAGLRTLLEREPLAGNPGIGHTRWATHGPPSQVNAHPHTVDGVSVVHNGIIENYLELRQSLLARGCTFSSETDTEIFAHLVAAHLRDGAGDLEAAVRATLAEVHGAYAIVVLSKQEPDRIVVAKNASPLVIGLGEGETFVASDVPAILPYTRRMVFMDEGELAVVTAAGARLTDLEGNLIEREPRAIAWTAVQAEKGGYKHFMLKEIFEQPRAVTDTLRGRFSIPEGRVLLDSIDITPEVLEGIRRIYVLACGTSWHAGLVGRLLVESFARIPTEIDLAHEFRYRDPVVGPDTLVVCISQSGETADTIQAARMASRSGARLLAICNVLDSTLARMADDVLYTHAGPEIGVASTKAFTSQLTAMLLLALYLGQQSGHLSPDAVRAHLEAAVELPEDMAQTLRLLDAPTRSIARRYQQARNFLFLGRGFNYPIALEGALKLKEISYIHAEGYAAGEMIDESMPVLVLAPRGSHYEKIMGNLVEAKARDGKVIAVATVGDHQIADIADHLLQIPDVEGPFQPLLSVLPLQLLAYHMADLLGTDVDQPRNLAKSVTVE